MNKENKNEKELSKEKLDEVSGGVLPINHINNIIKEYKINTLAISERPPLLTNPNITID